MSRPQQSPEAQDEEVLKVTIALLITAFIIIALIASQRPWINAVSGAVTFIHILPFAEMVRYMPFVLDIPLIGEWLFRMSALAHDFLLPGGFSDMNDAQLNSTLIAGGRAALVIYGPALIWILVRGRDFRVDRIYRQTHSLESMIRTQSEIWMTSRIALHVNPLKEPEVDARSIAAGLRKRLDSLPELPGQALPRQGIALKPGTWGRSLRPEEWLMTNGLIFDRDAHERLLTSNAMSRDVDFEFREKWESLDLESLSEVLAAQLRTPWTGPENLKPSLRALLAAMALFYNYDVEGGNRLLSDLGVLAGAVGGKPGKMDAAIEAEKGLLARIDEVISGKAGKKLLALGDTHAWLESAFPTFLAAARKDRGVLPAPAFLWLKAEDRLLWYILDNVGNEAIMIEAAGAIAHSRAEAQIGKPIRRPAVYQAARSLREDYLDLTEDRLKSRKAKEVRTRSPGQQVDLFWKDSEGTDWKAPGAET